MKTDLILINDYLRRYYAGNTTPAENAMLLSMLEAADESELTPELRTERDILRAIFDSAIERQSDIEVPDGLEQHILDATIGTVTEKAPERKRHYGILYRAAAAVAAVVLVFGISWRFYGSRNDAESGMVSPAIVARADASDSVAVPDAHASAAVPAEHLIAESTPAPEAGVRPTAARDAVVEPENNTIMITEQADSLEAVRITLLAFQAIDKAMTRAGSEFAPAVKRIEESNRQIENTVQIIKNSLI